MANDSALTYPIFTADGSGVSGSIGGTIAVLVNPFDFAEFVPLPLWTAIGYADEETKLPLWVAAGAGVVGVIGRSSATIPLWGGVDGSIAVLATATGESDATLPAWVSTGAGLSGVTGRSEAIELPIWLASAAGMLSADGTSNVVLPIWLADGYALLPVTPATIAALNASGISLNTKLMGMTAVSGWAFNSFAFVNGELLGATPTGLFVLTGDTDNGTAIASTVLTGPADLGSAQLKRAEGSLYVGYRTDGDLRIKVITDEDEDAEYTLEHHGHETLNTGRVKVGRGLKGRYWQLEITNLDGADFDLDTISLPMADLARKIG